jgi:hypothetical protein
MPKRNTWASQFAFKRRAIDRKILAEAERAIADEISFDNPDPAKWPKHHIGDEERLRIARAFGRPN